MNVQASRNKESGFTLIEVMVAIFIFVFGLLAIASLQVTSIRANSGANQKTAEAMLAQGVMEEILSFPKDNSNSSVINLSPSLAITQNWTQYPYDGSGNTYSVQGGGSYTASVTVTPDTPISNVSQITVTVTENGGHAISLTSYKRME